MESILTAKAAAYIGRNADYYQKKWEKWEKTAVFSGWNGAAFLFAPFWSSSRHMYGWTFFYFLFFVAVLTAESFFPVLLGLGADASPTLLLLLLPFLIIHTIFGLLGNAWYAQKINRIVEHHEGKRFLPPLFNKADFSLAVGVLVPVLCAALLAYPGVAAEQWVYNPPLENGVYVYSDNKPSPEGKVDVSRNPAFEKYETGISMFYTGDHIGDQSLTFKLYYDYSGEWISVREETVSFFTGDKLSLEILDAEDPATDTGRYRIDVYIEDTLFDSENFTITEPDPGS
jgi:hypothetical protein